MIKSSFTSLSLFCLALGLVFAMGRSEPAQAQDAAEDDLMAESLNDLSSEPAPEAADENLDEPVVENPVKKIEGLSLSDSDLKEFMAAGGLKSRLLK